MSVVRKMKEGTLISEIDDEQLPITQEPRICQVREGTWTSVGFTFANEGTEYCAITGHIYDEAGSLTQEI